MGIPRVHLAALSIGAAFAVAAAAAITATAAPPAVSESDAIRLKSIRARVSTTMEPGSSLSIVGAVGGTNPAKGPVTLAYATAPARGAATCRATSRNGTTTTGRITWDAGMTSGDFTITCVFNAVPDGKRVQSTLRLSAARDKVDSAEYTYLVGQPTSTASPAKRSPNPSKRATATPSAPSASTAKSPRSSAAMPTARSTARASATSVPTVRPTVSASRTASPEGTPTAKLPTIAPPAEPLPGETQAVPAPTPRASARATGSPSAGMTGSPSAQASQVPSVSPTALPTATPTPAPTPPVPVPSATPEPGNGLAPADSAVRFGTHELQPDSLTLRKGEKFALTTSVAIADGVSEEVIASFPMYPAKGAITCIPARTPEGAATRTTNGTTSIVFPAGSAGGDVAMACVVNKDSKQVKSAVSLSRGGVMVDELYWSIGGNPLPNADVDPSAPGAGPQSPDDAGGDETEHKKGLADTGAPADAAALALGLGSITGGLVLLVGRNRVRRR